MEYILKRQEKLVKLVGLSNSNQLWLQNIRDEWIHDIYEESDIHYGVIHSVHKSFYHRSTSITGFFQDQDTKKWIYVENGVADKSETDKIKKPFGWEDDLQKLMMKEINYNC
ncbi:molecular chaperone GrpE [Bacillaceae bacterium IKA-2]|nr:molecular chaperone GrpE [Bacillaceae bacterium IKA-2]